MHRSRSALETALLAHSLGLSVLPPKEDGTKAPIESWTAYQSTRADTEKIKEWYRNNRRGVGLVCGAVSGNLELFEFDDAATYDDYKEAARNIGLGSIVERIEHGYLERTPGGGVHWLYRCTEATESTKLATRPSIIPGKKVDALIETKGEGGFVIIAPSGGRTHETGRSYELVSGSLETIPHISTNERRALWELARAFNVLSPQEIKQANKTLLDSYDQSSPGNDFRARASWREILVPHGWQPVHEKGEATIWRRPGKRDGGSATTNYHGSDLFYPFTTSTEFEANRGYNKFAVYTILNHNGDFRAAASSLREQGYGHEKQYPRVILSHASSQASDDSVERAPEEPAENNRRYTLHHVSEAFEPQPPIEWVVEGLFSRGSVSIIVGPPGSKKTYSTLDCGVCVAIGEDWLDRATEQGPVLLIDEESGPRRLNRRLREITEGRGADATAPIWYTCLEMWNMRDEEDVSYIDSLMATVQPALVVIDALADVMPGADENSVKDTHPVMMYLRSLAEKHRCAIVIIHHSNKAGGYRGSTAIKSAVDLMLMIESEPASSSIKFSTEKARDTEPQTFEAIIRFEPGKVTLSEVDPIMAISQKKAAEGYVIRYLGDCGAAPLSAIMANANGCAPNSARKAVYELAKKGIVYRRDNGGRGRAAIYELAPMEDA